MWVGLFLNSTTPIQLAVTTATVEDLPPHEVLRRSGSVFFCAAAGRGIPAVRTGRADEKAVAAKEVYGAAKGPQVIIADGAPGVPWAAHGRKPLRWLVRRGAPSVIRAVGRSSTILVSFWLVVSG
jgi:hypothetical protein